MSTCDSIEGPLVKLKDGSVLRVNDISLAKKITRDVKEIIYLGDILFNYGDFFNRAHTLAPAGYCEEWWTKEFEKKMVDMFGNLDYDKISDFLSMNKERVIQLTKEFHDSTITGLEALDITEKISIPLHPQFTYYWNSLNEGEINSLFTWLTKGKTHTEDAIPKKIVIPFNEESKRHLEIFGVPHKLIAGEHVVIEGDDAVILASLISSWSNKDSAFELAGVERPLQVVNTIFKSNAWYKLGMFIGARMGRPEKAKVRKLSGQPHCLFPVGEEGGRLRCFQSALDAGKIVSDFPIFKCKCGNETVFGVCEKCGSKTKKMYFCSECGLQEKEKCDQHGKNYTYKTRAIDIVNIFNNTVDKLKLRPYPDLIKGVRGTSNKDHIPEHLAKGILRAKHGIPVNKDGTTRYDMTQLAITHFKPIEIGTPIEKLKSLGYENDIHGKPLIDENQVLELYPQDLILPGTTLSGEEGANEILFRVSRFIDDLLSTLYGLKPHYNLKSKSDVTGHLVIALAPHTSAGIMGRIIGFSQTQGFYAHPMFHAATRRDCDGDEACVTLLLDALLNFSRQYLPNTRGATQDAPLVLTSKLTPSEVDDMAFDVDVCWNYPLEFYEATLAYKKPWDIQVDQIGKRLNTWKQYEGMGYTHETSNINSGVKCSDYKLLPSMQEKLHGQMAIASKIRAVDESQVAKIVIEKHFIKDIKGNLRKFSQQQFRCVSCNEKYRRPPLMGKCTKCGGKIIFTISEGSIVKYLEPALSLANHYNLPDYIKQTLELTKGRVESIFGKDKEKQEGLGKWFG